MGSPTETFTTRQNPVTITCDEVACIFCGLPTPVPASSPSKFANRSPRHILIVRCRACGKEAPYRTCDLLEFDELLEGGVSRA